MISWLVKCLYSKSWFLCVCVLFSGPVKNWVTSYVKSSIEQVVSLLEEGCLRELLDDVKPDIYISVWYVPLGIIFIRKSLWKDFFCEVVHFMLLYIYYFLHRLHTSVVQLRSYFLRLRIFGHSLLTQYSICMKQYGFVCFADV